MPSRAYYEAEVDSGLEVVRGVRSRYDGVKRNPWDEFECGHHYARATSSWALLQALQGYQYSAPEARLRFAPKIARDGSGHSLPLARRGGRVEITPHPRRCQSLPAS